MTIDDFLYKAADEMRNGSFLIPEVILPAIEESRNILEDLAAQLEDEEALCGLEALDEASFEAYNLYAEALDLLELAVREDIPQLASEILTRTQEAKETLREVRRQAENHNQILQEETGARG